MDLLNFHKEIDEPQHEIITSLSQSKLVTQKKLTDSIITDNADTSINTGCSHYSSD